VLAGLLLIGIAACGSRREFGSNGERIYFTGRNEDARRIAYRGGPASGVMMAGRLVCASCHGADGKGGARRIHMSLVTAPDIRWSALMGEEGAEDDSHGGHAGYTLEVFRRAVVDGRHPDGAELDADMPRWSLSDRDLADVAAFLNTRCRRIEPLRMIERREGCGAGMTGRAGGAGSGWQ
jgi:hypothetical protein